MPRRIVRILLSVLLIPVLTGIGVMPCTAMGQPGPVTGTQTGAVHGDLHGHSHQKTGDPVRSPLRQHNHGPCDNSAGTNCCPAMPGCATVALPAIVTMQRPATVIVQAVHASHTELPIALTLAPEPPPPKA